MTKACGFVPRPLPRKKQECTQAEKAVAAKVVAKQKLKTSIVNSRKLFIPRGQRKTFVDVAKAQQGGID